MQTNFHKTLFYLDEDFKIEFEDAFPEVNLHCEVFKFSPAVLRRIYEVFVRLEEHFRSRRYARMFAITQNPKFCELFGGVRLFTIRDSNSNKEYEVVIWDLKLEG